MLQQHRNWYRTLAAALAASAIYPATAGAVPAIDGGQGSAPMQGQGVAAGGGPGVTPQTLTKAPQSLAAPDQVDRNAHWKPSASTAPTWPLNPKPIGQPATAQPSNDGGGLDTDVWIAIGGAALVAAGGIGVAGRKRLQTKRQPV
jgi:hypothetical protein